MTKMFHASAVIRGDAPALRDAAVVIDEMGGVIDVGPASELTSRHASATLERLRGVVFPGLVNAHTHVELSALRGRVPGGSGFVAWVEHMLSVRADVQPESDELAISQAVSELWDFGTALVGDVSNSLASLAPLGRKGLSGWVFHEGFGVGRSAALARASELEGETRRSDHGMRVAPTVHALYSTHRDGIAALAQMARKQNAKMSLHLAEHAAERRALETAEGPVASWIVRFSGGDTLDWPRKGPIEYADELGLLHPDVLLVHMTDAQPRELDRVIDRKSPIVLCPRSNLFIEVRLPPVLKMLELGIEPALGTDSLASNVSLDVLAEARALADRFPSLPPSRWLRMATWNGAQALGFSNYGRIAKGCAPGLVFLEGDLDGVEPERFVLNHVKSKRQWLVPPRSAVHTVS